MRLINSHNERSVIKEAVGIKASVELNKAICWWFFSASHQREEEGDLFKVSLRRQRKGILAPSLEMQYKKALEILHGSYEHTYGTRKNCWLSISSHKADRYQYTLVRS